MIVQNKLYENMTLVYSTSAFGYASESCLSHLISLEI